MIFWLIFILCSFIVSYYVSSFSPVRFRLIVLILVLVSLLTPEDLGIGSETPGPVMFTFLYDLIFEQRFNESTLRPLVFTLPLAFLLSSLLVRIKKRFFQS